MNTILIHITVANKKTLQIFIERNRKGKATITTELINHTNKKYDKLITVDNIFDAVKTIKTTDKDVDKVLNLVFEYLIESNII